MLLAFSEYSIVRLSISAEVIATFDIGLLLPSLDEVLLPCLQLYGEGSLRPPIFTDKCGLPVYNVPAPCGKCGSHIQK